MKKIFLSFFIFTLFSICFSQTNQQIIPSNLIKKQIIKSKSLDNLTVSLNYENVSIKDYSSSEILIEIYSNNNKKIPEIKFENKNLSIKSIKNYKKGDYCFICIYLPSNLLLNKFSLSNKTGSVTCTGIKAEDSFSISCTNSDLNIQKSKALYLDLFCEKGNVVLFKNYFDFFEINSRESAIDITLDTNIYGTSKIITEKGSILIKLNQQNLFDVSCDPFSPTKGKFTNNASNSNHPELPVIFIHTEKADITLEEY